MCPKNGGQYIGSHSDSLDGVFTEYTRDIRGIFMGYTYVSGMCRVCIGYVSGMRGNIRRAEGFLFKFRAGKVSICANKLSYKYCLYIRHNYMTISYFIEK